MAFLAILASVDLHVADGQGPIFAERSSAIISAALLVGLVHRRF